MSSTSHPSRIRTFARVLAACTVVLAASLAGVVPAGASVEARTFTIAGTLTVGGPPALTLPAGSTVTFDYDTLTGAITNGVTNIPTFDRGDVTGPQANITLTDAAAGTGNLDPVTGAGSLALAFNVSLAVPLLSAVCTLEAPVTLNVSTANAGGSPLTGTPATAVVTDAGFAISAVALSSTCPESSAALILDFLGLPTTDTAAAFTVTEVVSPAPAPPAPPAPAPARPTFTG
jgi:hypothetical protein